MRESVLAPRPVPNRVMPAVAGAFVIVLALPVYALAGWRLQGWGLGAVLWVGSQALGVLLGRLRLGLGNLAASGVLAIGMMFRAIAVMAVVFAVAVSDPNLALSAALLYALAYTFELGISLVTYFGAPVRS